MAAAGPHPSFARCGDDPPARTLLMPPGMKLGRLALTIAMLAGTACGSSKTGGGTGADVAIDDIVGLVDQTNCDLLVRCHVFSETAFCPLYFGPTRAGFDSLSAGVASVKAGRTNYDPAAARACIDAIVATSCSALANDGPISEACGRVFTGTLADGARCIGDGECLAGSFCAPPDASGCDGTCTRGGTLCNDDQHCTGGQLCDEDLPTATSQGTCVTPVPPGAANQPCGTKHLCATGLYCSNGGTARTCLPIGGQGATCAGEIDACADGLFCARTSGGTGICLPPAAKGAPCEASGQCGALLSTMTCDEATGTCVDAPTSGACVGATFACNPLSSYCDLSTATPTCKPYLATGAACSIFTSNCGLPGTALCVTTDPSTSSGTCAPPAVPATCVP
jgi:hypothetical protein